MTPHPDQITIQSARKNAQDSAEGLWVAYCQQQGIRDYLEQLERDGYAIVKQSKIDTLEAAVAGIES